MNTLIVDWLSRRICIVSFLSSQNSKFRLYPVCIS